MDTIILCKFKLLNSRSNGLESKGSSVCPHLDITELHKGKGLERILLTRCWTEEDQIHATYLESLSQSLHGDFTAFLPSQLDSCANFSTRKINYCSCHLFISAESCFTLWRTIIVCTPLDFSFLDLTIPIPSHSVPKHLYLLLWALSIKALFFSKWEPVTGRFQCLSSALFNILLLELPYRVCVRL